MKTLVADKNALRLNLSEVRSRAGNAEIVADLSADGQGLGLLRMARFLVEEGVEHFAVTEVRDAVALRKGGFQQVHILMLRSITDLRELQELMDYSVTFTIGSNEAGIALNGLAGELHTVAEARIRIDTGLGQYGFLPSETDKMLNLYRHMPGIAITGMYTRMSGVNLKSAAEAQYQAFMGAAETLRGQGVELGSLMALDSCSLFRLEVGEQNAVLVGSALIGRTPLKTGAGLVKVGSIEASLEEIKWLPEGTVVGLGKGKALKKPTRVAVLDLGWANGIGILRRSTRQELPLLKRLKVFVTPDDRFEPVVKVGGKRVPILGQTGMTALTLDVTKCECAPNDLAILDADPRDVRFLPVEMRE
ncbi:MAG: alanine racemase [Oscillospiraceae bacterium]|nr:alanine racemase [Oscillospiraceae bacterium]